MQNGLLAREGAQRHLDEGNRWIVKPQHMLRRVGDVDVDIMFCYEKRHTNQLLGYPLDNSMQQMTWLFAWDLSLGMFTRDYTTTWVGNQWQSTTLTSVEKLHNKYQDSVHSTRAAAFVWYFRWDLQVEASRLERYWSSTSRSITRSSSRRDRELNYGSA